MAQVENINGSQIVSKDLTVGGKSTVRNSAQFDRGVVIKGWLDAPNVKHAYKGLYQTADDLAKAYPKPQRGWYAAVANYEIVKDGATIETETLEGNAIVYVEYDGSWVPTNMTTTQLNDYVNQFEETIDNLTDWQRDINDWIGDTNGKEGAEQRLETLESQINDEKVWRTDVAEIGEGNHNGVMSVGMAYQLDRLHRATCHISYFVSDSSGLNIIDGKPEDSIAAIYYLRDKATFVASTEDVSVPTADTPLYSEWDENERAGFHPSSRLVYNPLGHPYQKLYHAGNFCYYYDSRFEEMVLLGVMDHYVAKEDIASTTALGILKVLAEHGLTISADGTLSLALATETADGAMSAEDKAKLNKLNSETATEEKNGMMSSTDKTILDHLSQGIPYFTEIFSGIVATHGGTLEEPVAVYYVESATNRWIAMSSDGGYYTSWNAYGAFLSSDYYTLTPNKAYISNGVLYRYDEIQEKLIVWCDLSLYITINDLATQEKDGLLSAQDKTYLDSLVALISSGRISNGTMRFDRVICSEEYKVEIYNNVDDDPDGDGKYMGVIWLCKEKMFVAYNSYAVSPDDGSEPYVLFRCFKDWDKAVLYMESVGTADGLWKDKVYIGEGHVWMYKRCYETLCIAGGAEDYEVLTNEEIDEIFADFNFVEPSTITGLLKVRIDAADPLVAGDTQYDDQGNAVIPLSITEVTEKEIDNITGKED